MRKAISDIGGAVALATSLLLTPAALAQSERGESDGSSLVAPEEKKRELPPGAEDLPPPSAGELLAERKRELDAREAELEQAEKDLKLAEQRLEARIAKLEAVLAEKQRIQAGIRTSQEKEKDARLTRLTDVTSKMPPENAAAYLFEMSIATTAKILEGLKPRKAAAIMAALPPSKAAEIGRKYLRSGNASPKPSPSSGGEAGREPTGGGASDDR